MAYSVYVIELDKAFALTSKSKKENPNASMDKPCIYVGYTSKRPEVRFFQHKSGARNKRGKLFSSVVLKYGIRLRPRLYERYNPIPTIKEALAMEKKLTEKYRKRGYTVWSK